MKKLYIVLAIELGSSTSGSEWEYMQEDIRQYAATRVQLAGCKLIAAKTKSVGEGATRKRRRG